jgi:TonB-dependent starch-binding outer membrane protein SusC
MKKCLLMFMAVFLYTVAAFAQGTISGKVQDKSGTSLSGASVKSKTDLATTDANGSFTVKAQKGETLEISYVGMIATTAKANDGMVITMNKAVKAETEIIVTGYASKNKRSNTGSAVSVSVDDLKSQPIASFDQLLQGQAPGLSAKSNSGQPGAAAQVIIRGRGSITGSISPLYIIDGIEISPADFATINPGDFESVTVLKDAVTAGIYGSRGANGVIVITTKKGKAGATKFSYDFQYGASKFPNNKLKLMNTAEKLAYEKVNGNPNGWSPTQFDSLSKISTDWEDVFFRTGTTQSHQVSASGGSDKSKFYASFGYFDQKGIVQATNLKRYTVRLNLETGTDRVKIGVNTQIGYSEFSNTQENNQGIASPLNALRWTLPYYTPKDANGNYVQDRTGSAQPNALQELLENTRQFPQIKGIGNIYVDYNIPGVKGLSLRTNVGMDYRNDEGTIFNAPTTYLGRLATGGKGSLLRSTQNSYRLTNTNSINYKKTINDVHDITVFAAQEYILRKSNNFNFTGFGFTEPFFQNIAGVSSGTTTNNFTNCWWRR